MRTGEIKIDTKFSIKLISVHKNTKLYVDWKNVTRDGIQWLTDTRILTKFRVPQQTRNLLISWKNVKMFVSPASSIQVSTYLNVPSTERLIDICATLYYTIIVIHVDCKKWEEWKKEQNKDRKKRKNFILKRCVPCSLFLRPRYNKPI